MLKNRTLLTIILTLFMLAGCGYVEDNPVKDSRILVVGDLQSGCKIDTDRIKKMFEELVTEELNCIESQLEKFKYVKTDNREILTEADLQRFITKYFSDNPQDIIDGLNLLFKLNSLLLKDEPGQMRVKNIKSFFELLKIVNRDAVTIVDLVELMKDEKDGAVFMEYRAMMGQTIARFSNSIVSIIQSKDGRVQNINIEDLIIELTKNLDDFKLGRELINSLLFVKKLFLGGSRVYISTEEALRMFKQFPAYAMNIFDIFLLKEEVFKTKTEYYEHIANNLEQLKANVYQHQNEELILTITDLDRIIDEFFNDDKSISDWFGSNAQEKSDKIKKIIRAFKKDLVGGSELEFSYRDVEISLAFINIGIRSVEKISKIGDLVEDMDDLDLARKLEIKNEFLNTFKELSEKAKELIEGNQDIPAQMKLLTFVQSLASDTDLLNVDPQLINSIFSIKVGTVGGSRDIVTIPELIKALERAEDFAKLYFDLQYLAEDYFDLSDKAKFVFFERQVNQLSALLLDNTEVENVITMADIDIIIDQFFKDTDEDKEKGTALKALAKNLKINILGTDKEYLNLNEVKSTVNLAALAFKAMVFTKFHEELKQKVNEGKEDLGIAKLKYKQEFAKITADMKKYLENPTFLMNDIKIYELIDELRDSKAIFDIDVELFKLATNFKSLIVGGENTIIKRTEFLYLATNGAKIADSLFDLTFNKFNEIKPNKSLYKFIISNLRNIRSILPKAAEDKVYFNLKDGLLFADKLIRSINKNSDSPKDEEDLITVSNFKRTIIDFSERILAPVPRSELSYPAPCQPDPKNAGKFICSQDDPANAPDIDLAVNNKIISKLLDVADEAISALYFAEVTYDYFENDLLSTKPVTIGFYPNLAEYDLIDSNLIIRFKAAFTDVAKNNRYFRDSENYAFYQREIIRNKIGFTSLVLMRTVLPYALTGYGDEGYTGDPTAAKGLAVNQLQDLLVGIKSVLEEIGLWTTNFESFGQNILLLSDLFQSRSNGDLFINLNEASEFVELIFSSAKLGSNMIDVFKTKCEVNYTADGGAKVNTECVRNQFFDTLFTDLNLGKYFPRLKKYKDSVSKREAVEYIKGVEGFARDVPDLNIPWEIRDFTLVLGAMLNIESTFIRFDSSYDNKLDFNELKKSLGVYENAIIMLANLKGKNKKLARTVFFYMVKYMKAPAPLTVWSLDKIFKIHFKKIKATRLNISALLFYLVNSQNEKVEYNEDEAGEIDPSKTETDSLSQLGFMMDAYADALAQKTGEEVEAILDSIAAMYEDTKNFLSF
ncbi:hypothetical protein [Bacteriovorax sp. Seq25_V]|uniref:hypothetical protein n=1 Tax=Bacteriovorax sp. Seq25_V TaxID=1201288 RepID=UPI00038A2AC1|nr:hypothetical protein [Bacteriovorax sp. Seq25_V]EQC43751.1 hypothetical protein M900_1469 [Bacteriovorax sp. Seq25_V]